MLLDTAEFFSQIIFYLNLYQYQMNLKGVVYKTIFDISIQPENCGHSCFDSDPSICGCIPY